MKAHNLCLFREKYSENILNENFNKFDRQDMLDLMLYQTLSENFYRKHSKLISITTFANFQNIKYFSESFIEKLLETKNEYFFDIKSNVLNILECANLTKHLILKHIDIFYKYSIEIMKYSNLTNEEKQLILEEIKDYNNLKEII